MSDKQTPKTFEEWRDLYPSNQFPIFIIGNDSLNHHIESYARQVWNARDAEINELKEVIKKKNNSIRFEMDALGGYLLSINAPVSVMREFSKTRKLVESILIGDKDE